MNCIPTLVVYLLLYGIDRVVLKSSNKIIKSSIFYIIVCGVIYLFSVGYSLSNWGFIIFLVGIPSLFLLFYWVLNYILTKLK